MKQSFFFALLIFLMSFSTFASGLKNPLQRICAEKGGQFWIYGAGEVDQYPVCRFGTAEIGALDMVRALEGESAYSIQAFLSSAAALPNQRSCIDFNSSLRLVFDTTGSANLLCVFTDGSLLDRETLTLGTNDPRNQQLKEALESL